MHERICFLSTVLERPIDNYESGIATATLRVRDSDNPQFQEHLRDTFVTLFDLYGPGYFDLSVTANVVLQSHVDQRFSVFYGQDFADRSFSFGRVETIRNLGDVAGIDCDFDLNDFEDVFFRNFENTEVSILKIVSVVFLITRYLDNFERDKTSVGRQLVRLF